MVVAYHLGSAGGCRPESARYRPTQEDTMNERLARIDHFPRRTFQTVPEQYGVPSVYQDRCQAGQINRKTLILRFRAELAPFPLVCPVLRVETLPNGKEKKELRDLNVKWMFLRDT